MNVSRFTALLPPGSRKKLSEKTLNRWFAIYRHAFTTGPTDRFDTDLQTGCWVVCFWWMHRLSGRQRAMLEELQEGQADRKVVEGRA